MTYLPIPILKDENASGSDNPIALKTYEGSNDSLEQAEPALTEKFFKAITSFYPSAKGNVKLIFP